MTWQAAYAEFVAGLMFKDGVPSPTWVLALGLCGEVAELSQVSCTDDAAELQILHELGDVLWYVTAMQVRLGLRPGRDTPTLPDLTIDQAAGAIADMVKKQEWHGKPMSSAAVDSCLAAILLHVEQLAELLGETLENVAELNTEKLRKRYPQGFVNGGGLR